MLLQHTNSIVKPQWIHGHLLKHEAKENIKSEHINVPFPCTISYSSSGSLESREEYTLNMSSVHPWVHTPFTPGKLLYLSTIKTFRLYSPSVYQRCNHLHGDSDRPLAPAGTITCRSNQLSFYRFVWRFPEQIVQNHQGLWKKTPEEWRWEEKSPAWKPCHEFNCAQLYRWTYAALQFWPCHHGPFDTIIYITNTPKWTAPLKQRQKKVHGRNIMREYIFNNI